MMQNEEENIVMLQSMMGDLDAEVARRVLAKHNNDIQAAASAILEGDRGEEASVSWPSDNPFDPSAGGSGALSVPGRPNTPRTPERNQHERIPLKDKDVIDLTAENDPDLSRALQMSLEQTQSQSQNINETTFHRSDRAPDPNWAMVPSNVPSTTVQEQEDQSLSRAIEASLSTSYIEDKYEDLPEEEKVRKPGQPVALRTSSNELYFATLVLQALFHVPQVRERLALWRWKGNEKGLQPSPDSPEHVPYVMSGLFTYIDHALVSYISIDGLDIVADYKGRLASSATDLPGDLSNDLYSYIARAIENQLRPDNTSSTQNWERLFHLRYAPLDSPPTTDSTSEPNALGIENCQPFRPSKGSDTACVRVDLRGADGPNDLLSCLSSQLGLERSLPTDGAPDSAYISQAQALVAPSEVIAFELVRPSQIQGPVQSQNQQNSSQSSPIVVPFRYPMHVYLDQFLLENAALTAEKRASRNEMEKRLRELSTKKEASTQFEGKATLKSLTSALYYFENVATKDNPASRAEDVKSAATSLQKILTRITTEVQTLDTQISGLKLQLEKIFDDPLLQKHRYDLRAVLVHDGLFGRSHIHSFVQHAGKWWKCQDASVVEVSEEVVLTDTTGLHLGAGPYMLIYSRETEEVNLKSCWPTFFKNNAKTDNSNFLRLLDEVAPETAASVRATYAPSPLRVPASLPNTSPEAANKASRRSMSAMSIVDEGVGGGDADLKDDMEVV